MTELLPCPFCGEAALKIIEERQNNSFVGIRINCPTCFATSCLCPNKRGSYAAWNTRAPHTPTGDRAKALEAIGRVKEYRDEIWDVSVDMHSISNGSFTEDFAIIEAAITAPEPTKITYWDFESEMEDITNRDNGKIVSDFIMRRFPNGLIITADDEGD